jgi:hypothetical protein
MAKCVPTTAGISDKVKGITLASPLASVTEIGFEMKGIAEFVTFIVMLPCARFVNLT